MPGKLLIVDSIATNRIVLKVRLSAAFYEVFQASDAHEAKALLEQSRPDLVLINGHLTDCDSLEFCAQIRKLVGFAHVPIVLLVAKPDRAYRIKALKAGVTDVLVRPLDDLVLLARLRSLIRTHASAEEHKLRESTNQVLGLAEQVEPFQSQARILLAAPDAQTSVRWKAHLRPMVPFHLATQLLGEAMGAVRQMEVPDVFVIAVNENNPDLALRLLAEIRAGKSTRHSGILVVLAEEHRRLLADALDLGANDVMTEGFDPEEMALRLSTLVQQKRLADRLRDNVQTGLQAAVTDPLTGLFNRRYALPHLERISKQAVHLKRHFAVFLVDLDHFKAVNDQYGHAAGDAVLAETARRMRENLRPVDLVARIGGEEFLVALPDISAEDAQAFASRLCRLMRERPVSLKGDESSIPVTMSIGATLGGACRTDLTVDRLISEADRALYDAKLHGRDQVRFCEMPQ